MFTVFLGSLALLGFMGEVGAAYVHSALLTPLVALCFRSQVWNVVGVNC